MKNSSYCILINNYRTILNIWRGMLGNAASLHTIQVAMNTTDYEREYYQTFARAMSMQEHNGTLQ